MNSKANIIFDMFMMDTYTYTVVLCIHRLSGRKQSLRNVYWLLIEFPIPPLPGPFHPPQVAFYSERVKTERESHVIIDKV